MFLQSRLSVTCAHTSDKQSRFVRRPCNLPNQREIRLGISGKSGKYFWEFPKISALFGHLTYKPVHTGMYLHKRIYDIITTGIYWYSLTESVMYPFKKSVSKTPTRDFPHTVRRISPCTTGVYTLTLECRPSNSICLYITYVILIY